MRLTSAECQDFHQQGKKVMVRLNGKLVKACTMADEEQGVIERAALTHKGHYIINEAQDDIVRIVERGTVRIEIVSTH